MDVNDFENKIKLCLTDKCKVSLEDLAAFCKEKNAALGAAVSGGADSVSLLISLCHICKDFSIPLKVISVNHYIRPDAETCGDVQFVLNLCEKLKKQGFNVEFFAKELKKGQVSAAALERKMGIEEAARFLRYEAFEKFIGEENLAFLCLAHNKNDFYETVLMRFLQGSSCDSSWGISYRRNCFIRPLMDVSRTEIEDYLNKIGQEWRTDKTNFDDSYFRNKVRGKLIPFLNENFEGWETALEAGSHKDFDDSEFISEQLEKIKIFKENDNSCYVNADVFFNNKKALKNRLLLKMCNIISENNRISYKFLLEVCKSFEENMQECNKSGKNCTKFFADIKISLEKNRVYVRKNDSFLYDFCFSDIINETGFYEFDWGSALVCNDEKKSGFVKINLKYKSGAEKTISVMLPYQLNVNHM